jgi:hypothetical protein
MRYCSVFLKWLQSTREYEILFRSDLEGLRMMLALGSIYTGIEFALWPVSVFPTAAQLAVGEGRHTYALMAELAPEWVWGWAMILQGGISYHSLHTRTYTAARLWCDAALGAFIWVTAVMCCYFAYWPSDNNLMLWRIPKIMGMEAVASVFMIIIVIRYTFTEKKKNGIRS